MEMLYLWKIEGALEPSGRDESPTVVVGDEFPNRLCLMIVDTLWIATSK